MKILNANEKERCKIEKNEKRKRKEAEERWIESGKVKLWKLMGKNKTTRWRHKQETINK